MVFKHCPACRKTLAVACKTCIACGYVFQKGKPVSSKGADKRTAQSGDRQCSDRNRKDLQKGNYGLDINTEKRVCELVLGKEDSSQETHADTIENFQEQGARKQPSSNSINATPPAKKRGRPKGSKDKQKRLPKGYKQLKLVRNAESTPDTEWAIKAGHTVEKDGTLDDTKLQRKRGRPRGSKNKTSIPPLFYAEDFDDFDSDDREECSNQADNAYYIPADKKEKFALILQDINQRIVGQEFRV